MKGLGIVFMSILFLSTIGMDSKELAVDEGVQELDSLSQSIDSVFLEMEAERIDMKFKLEQSLKETNQDLVALKQLLTVYSIEEKGLELISRKKELELKKKELFKIYEELSEDAGKDWQDLKEKMEALDE